MLDQTPNLALSDAERLARDLYGLEAVATALDSERDQNFDLTCNDGRRIVLKIANARETREILDAQHRVLDHLASRLTVTPTVIPTLTGAPMAETAGPGGTRYFAWAISHLPGVTLAETTYRSRELLVESHDFPFRYGHTLAALRRALADFDHPALHRAFHWDLANARGVIDEHRALIDDPVLGAAIDALVREFDRSAAPRLASLPRAVIHGDLNDHNVLVAGEVTAGDRRVSGIVDFGDMVHSYAIGDFAIAAAYAMLHADDPLIHVRDMLDGYRQSLMVTDAEVGSLFGLIALRLCASACIAAHQTRVRPDNRYLDVSQAAIRQLLPRLAAIPFAFAEAILRGTSAASTRAEPVRRWLEKHAGTFAPVLHVDLRTAPCLMLDLSVGSPLIRGDPRENTEPFLTERIVSAMRSAGVEVGIGQYLEPRVLYTSDAFAEGVGTAGGRRTIHLGLDLFASAGTPVHAPLSGVVHAFAENRGVLDYGPVIILRHEPAAGITFFTLYGHLSRESLEGLVVGQPVTRGQRIATLGVPAVNGGWTPHLHLQIMTDLIGLGTDFPGVGAPRLARWWEQLAPDPNLLINIPDDHFPAALRPGGVALRRRRELLGPNLSLAYDVPLELTRGWKQHVYDGAGRRYLDAYNNVPHVGHCHPRVVSAGQEQMARLNTNTRYGSDVVIEYAERLVATMPVPLRVCWFLNSASEANELALRLTRAHTGRRDMIVLDAAYHGNTSALIDLSPYKHAGPGGHGAPDWVRVAPLPDDYRGPYKRSDPAAGPKYAEALGRIVDAMHASGRALAGFIAETCPSVGGQIMLPSGYLADVYDRVRAAGGLCIADEVQTGLGRIGTHLWAFEAQGVIPDIVVLGKPLGNGHPLAAVVTTREIADSFDNGMEFFSTFGGNTVSCAIGSAVLDVMRDEGLQSHALRVGDRMLAGLSVLAERSPLVGDVRGSGLFLGVELVRDRRTREPAGREAAYVANRMRELGILLGTDGPYHNVIKIRPPMPFNDDDAELLVQTMGKVLKELR